MDDLYDLPTEEYEEVEDDRRYRTVGIAAVCLLALVIATIVVVNSSSETVTRTVAASTTDSTSRHHRRNGMAGIPPPPMVLSRMPLRDTVYTTDSLYLDVNLAKQNVTVRFRDGTSRTFLISSGNPAIREGIATPAGLYTIQNMEPMAISKQFNDARLHHWIGIQGGVGFHGLDGSGYYGNLGVRPSSHGCVRMSREEIAQMYNLVHPGALIMVHQGVPARVVAFCAPDDTADAVLIDSGAVYNKYLGKEQLHNLYEGKYWSNPQPRLVHLARQKFRWGMEIGDAKRIPKQNIPETPLLSKGLSISNPYHSDRLSLRPIADEASRIIVAALKTQQKQDQMRAEQKTAEYGE